MQRLAISPPAIAFLASVAIHGMIALNLNKPLYTGLSTSESNNLHISLLPKQHVEPKKQIPSAKKQDTVSTRTITPAPAPVTKNDEPVETQDMASSEKPDLILPSESLTEPLQPPSYNANYLDNPSPVYPLAARRRNIEGQVLLMAEVQTDGSCSQVAIKKPSKHDLLNQAALEAVKKWRFIPATLGGETIVAWVEIPITFKLQ